MAFVVGGFAAIVALAAGIIGQVDSLTSLWRAALAFVLGWIAASVWQAVIASTVAPEASSNVSPASPGEAGTS